MRAVAIRVDDVSGVAGFVTPGDRVDVILTRDLDQSIQAHTILQNLKVLGIDQDADKKVRDKPSIVRTITVEVEPNDVQKVALAQQAGKLSLSLRNMETADTTRLDTITVQDLTDEDRPAPVKPVTAELPSVSVNRGGERSSVTVPSG